MPGYVLKRQLASVQLVRQTHPLQEMADCVHQHQRPCTLHPAPCTLHLGVGRKGSAACTMQLLRLWNALEPSQLDACFPPHRPLAKVLTTIRPRPDMANQSFSHYTMPQLPNDVLLAIVSATDIDTFLTIRLLDRETDALVNTYTGSTSEAVARSTFPRQTRIFAQIPMPMPATAVTSLRWLRELQYLQLAFVVLEWNATHPVSAEDPLGDEYKDCLARGWKVLERLGAIERKEPVLDLRHRAPQEKGTLEFERLKA